MTEVRKPLIVWFLLVVGALASWMVAELQGGGADTQRVGTLIVLGVAFGKVLLVGLHFMELDNAPPLLRRLFEAWVVGVCAVLVVLFMLGD